MTEARTANWIGVDWGTSRLRAWAMHDESPLWHGASDDGMGGLTRDGYEAALLALVDDWLPQQADTPIPVIACGMCGSRQGWVEAPYTAVPAPPLTLPAAKAPATDPRLQVFVVGGLKQTAPADVMRGEETQIAGFLALNDGWDGVICLPGTHSKWVHVSAGEVVSFRTFMTGELFALLGTASVLRHSVASQDWDSAAFDAALSESMSRPESLASRLFSLRARHLLENTSPATLRAELSGFLIGAELAAARPYWLGQQLAVLGSHEAANPYAKALGNLGAPVTVADGARMTLAGLTAARRLLKDRT